MNESIVQDEDFDEDDGQQVSFVKSVGGSSPVGRSWGADGVFRLVGNGDVTKDSCGKFLTVLGCRNIDAHDVISEFDGKNHKGEMILKKTFYNCGKPSCPVCYLAWAKREAERAEPRLKEASKRYGQIEHVSISPPQSDWGLSVEALRKKTAKALAVRGLIGGVLIFHPFRYHSSREARIKGGVMGWFFSPHFHYLGFVLGGYGRCRQCKDKKCRGYGNFNLCDGYDARTRRENEKDGFVCKVLGARKTIFGTLWYQANHAGYDSSKKHSRITTWFGVCSYRKLKVTVERRRSICPICLEDLVKLRWCGDGFHVDEHLTNGWRGWWFTKNIDDWCLDESAGYGGKG
jgi:hypothetical protein